MVSCFFNSSTPTAFDEDDLAVASSFARMVSLGYARFLDFENLDRQNHALEAANRQVEQASLNKSQFLRRMSHALPDERYYRLQSRCPAPFTRCS